MDEKRIECGVDWLTIVAKKSRAYRPPELENFAIEEDRGMYGYNNVYRYPDGRIEAYNTEREDMGVLTVYNGTAIRNISDKINFVELIKKHVERSHHATRIDLFIDLHNYGWKVKDFAEMTEARQAVTFIKSALFIEQKLGEGDTLWFGKGRPKQLRIYDKAAERGVIGDWIRIEAQFRKKQANDAMMALCRSQNALKAIVAAIRGTVDFPKCKKWTEVMDSEIIRFSDQKAIHSNRWAWIMNPVASAIASEIVYGDNKVLDKLNEEVIRRVNKLIAEHKPLSHDEIKKIP